MKIHVQVGSHAGPLAHELRHPQELVEDGCDDAAVHAARRTFVGPAALAVTVGDIVFNAHVHRRRNGVAQARHGVQLMRYLSVAAVFAVLGPRPAAVNARCLLKILSRGFQLLGNRVHLAGIRRTGYQHFRELPDGIGHAALGHPLVVERWGNLFRGEGIVQEGFLQFVVCHACWLSVIGSWRPVYLKPGACCVRLIGPVSCRWRSGICTLIGERLRCVTRVLY